MQILLREPTEESRILRRQIFNLLDKATSPQAPRRSARQLTQLVLETFKLWYALSKSDRALILKAARALKAKKDEKKIARLTRTKYKKLTLVKSIKTKKSKNILNVQPVEIVDVFC